LGVLHIAATAGLQIAAVRCNIDRRNVENGGFSGFRQPLAQLISGVISRCCSSFRGPSTSPCGLVSTSSKLNTATLSGSARAGIEAISVNAMRTKMDFKIGICEIQGGVATKRRLQGKTIPSCFKPEAPLSSVQSRRNVRED